MASGRRKPSIAARQLLGCRRASIAGSISRSADEMLKGRDGKAAWLASSGKRLALALCWGVTLPTFLRRRKSYPAP